MENARGFFKSVIPDLPECSFLFMIALFAAGNQIFQVEFPPRERGTI
jgi:hypothetical protein